MARANSYLSPVHLRGARQADADAVGAAIDNLVEPVRRGRMSIRRALELVAKEAFRAGYRSGTSR